MDRVAGEQRANKWSVEQFFRRRGRGGSVLFLQVVLSRALATNGQSPSRSRATHLGGVLACVLEQDLDPARMRRRKLLFAAHAMRAGQPGERLESRKKGRRVYFCEIVDLFGSFKVGAK